MANPQKFQSSFLNKKLSQSSNSINLSKISAYKQLTSNKLKQPIHSIGKKHKMSMQEDIETCGSDKSFSLSILLENI